MYGWFQDMMMILGVFVIEIEVWMSLQMFQGDWRKLLNWSK